MGISIRMALPGERTKLEDLQRRASLVSEQDRAQLLAHPEAIHLPLSHLLAQRVRVAEIADRIIGFCAVIPKSGKILELDGLFVEPDHWRNGVGRALIADGI